VTGGTGFVGSHLVQELIALGARVVVMSRSSDPYGYFASEQLHQRVILAQGDVNDERRVFDIVTKYEISSIYHLAAQPLVTTALINPRETLETNIMGTVNVLEAARRSPLVEGVILASSDKAYGKLDRPYRESDPLKGDHPYEVSKSAADLIAQTYSKTYNVPVVITRFGNIYGAGDTNPSRVVPGILLSVLRNEPFQIRSSGQYKRAYVHVNDVVSGYIVLAVKAAQYKGESFNFGSSEIYSVIDLVHLIEDALHISIPYDILNTAINEIPSQSLSFEKARSFLSWSPKYRLGEQVLEMFEWYSQYIHHVEGNRNTSVSISPSSSTIFSVS